MKHYYYLKFSLLLLLFFVAVNLKAVNINAGGTISSTTTWNADTVKVTSDITIADGVQLIIYGGTYVQFQGHYKIDVKGRISAYGSASNRIVFTALSPSVGWAGIRYENTPQTNGYSYFRYCTFTYGNANQGNGNDQSGGAFFMYDFSKVKIQNSIFSNNYASSYGGAIALEYNASPEISNCLIVNNSSGSTGGGIDIYNQSNPKLLNNTIAYNTSSNGGGVWASNYSGEMINCIVYANSASNSSQVYGTVTNMSYCNIQGGYSTGTTIFDTLPEFVSPASGAGNSYDGLSADYSLASSSYLIDKGTNDVMNKGLMYFDVNGKFRFDNKKADIGAYEKIVSQEVCGSITTNTTWSGSILMNCNVTVNNGVTLTIAPGTEIITTSYVRLDVKGRLLAQGSSDDYITMRPFGNNSGWYGITFSNVATSNDTSKIEYCKLSYKRYYYTSSSYNRGAISVSNTSKVLIRNNILSNNYGKYGGAISLENSNAKVVGNLIVNNQSKEKSAGIYINASSSYSPLIANNTIANNKLITTTTGAGIYVVGGATPILKNNIIYNNQDNSGNHAKANNIYPSSGLNLTYSCVEGGYTGTGNISSSPLFKNKTPLAGIPYISGAGYGYNLDNFNFALNANSLAIDAGASSTVGLNLPTYDLAGKARNYSAAIDMGAYEDKSQITLSCSGGNATISSDQVWDANVININCDVTINSGATVSIIPGTKVLFNGHYRIYVKGAIQAIGSEGDSVLFTSANTTTGWDGIQLDAPNAYQNDSSIFDYCRFEYANRTPSSYQLGGGAISIKSIKKVRVTHNRFIYNKALGSYGYGGALSVMYLHNSSTVAKFNNNIFEENEAKYAAVNFQYSYIEFKNNVIDNNITTNYGGLKISQTGGHFFNNLITNNTGNTGGVYMSGDYSDYILHFYNNIVANNHGNNYGGGIGIISMKPYLYNNTIVNNESGVFSRGGGICFEGNSDANLKNNIIYGNKTSSSTVANQICIGNVSADPKFYNNDIEGGIAAFTGGGAGINYTGVFTNNVDVDPDFVSPSSGADTTYNGRNADWSIDQGSAVINAGFANSSTIGLPLYDFNGDPRFYNGRVDIGAIENQEELIAPCTISENTVWEADTIKVQCDITIDNLKTLTIKPGTNVIFEGYYGITVNGAIVAKGTADNKIHFTRTDTTGFWDSTTTSGGWNGINFSSVLAVNDSSKFENCTFTFGKAPDYTGGTYAEENGGAMNIYNSPKISIENCIFANNYAENRAGAITIESSNIIFRNNIIANNKAGSQCGGFFIDDCSINFFNNTVVNNQARYYGGGQVYGSEMVIKNSLFWGNTIWSNNSGYYSQLSFYSSSLSKVYNSDFQYGQNKIGYGNQLSVYQDNIEDDPQFVNASSGAGYIYDGLNANWNVSTSSPVLNKGFYGSARTSLDFSGNNRVVSDTIDIGAYEIQISPRFIDVQPSNKEICEGASGTLKAHASVGASYQWQKDGASIAGATHSILQRNSVALSDTGFYNCIISNAYGSISSDTVELTVLTAPSVISSPSSTSECLGSSVTFDATVEGSTPITYQWYNTNGALGTGSSNQSYEIGDDTLRNTPSSYPSPFANYFWGNKEQYLILASELTAMGVTAGDISSLGFDVYATNSCPTLSNFEIKIGSTSSSALSSSWVSGLSSVYSVSSYQVSSGWNNFGFTSSFTWDGSSNIVVEICSNNSSWISNGNASVNQSNTSFYSSHYLRKDNTSSICSDVSTGSLTTRRPNIKISGASSGSGSTSYEINSITANSASNYYLIATNSCGSDQSNGATLGIKYKPSLTPISAADNICEDGSYAYSTTVSQGTTPITYQWFKDGTAVSNANSLTYNITNADTSDAGIYYCKGTNTCGSDSTNQSVLTVNEKPQIISQSSSQTICENQSFSLGVTASGTGPLTYQWYKDGSAISGATNNIYTVSSVSTSDAATYVCKVSNSCVSTPVASTGIVVTVKTAPSITSQTGTIDICSGSAAPFSVTATGTATLTYQWYNASGSISSATNNSYTISSASTSDAGNYYCVVSNTCGNATSNSIPLTVNTQPTISSQPSSVTKCEGQSAVLNVQSTGTATITYQWYKGGNSISGATSSSYLVSPVATTDAASYYCVATNSCGSDQSSAANITVNVGPTITSQSSSSTICEGATPTFQVSVTGTSPLTYQWYNDNGSISGANSSSYSIASADTSDAGNYYCIATNSCSSETSNSILLSVNQSPTITNQPSSSSVCENLSAIFNVSATGTSPLSYQWYNSSGAISGATNASYIIPQASSSSASSYYVKVSNACGDETSNTAALTVNDNVAITAQTSSSTVCSGSSPSFSITTSGTAPVTYQWYKDNTAISGATNNSYNLTSVDTSDAATYYAIATNTCNSVQSNQMSLTVNVAPSISSQPSSATVCEGLSHQFNVSATGTSSLTYQWYKGSNAISGATSTIYLLSQVSSSDAASYYVKVSNACGDETSNTAALTVNDNVAITAQTSSSTVCSGSSPSFSITTSGTAPVTYQWYKDNTAISGATNNSYNLTSVDTSDAATYYAIATNSCNTVQSNQMSLTVNVAPSISSQPSSATVCSGTSYQFVSSASGTSPISYQWYKGSTAITGAISSTYLLGQIASTDAGTYYLKATNSCGNATSNTATLTVNNAPVISSQSGSISQCENTSALFTLTATGSNPLTYQWYSDTGMVSGANANSYTIASISTSDAGNYYCVVSNTCGNATSSNKTLTVNTVPSIVSQSSDDTLCEYTNSVLQISTTGTNPISYQWYKNSSVINGAVSSNYTLASVDTTDAGIYYAIATNACGSDQSNNMLLTINKLAAISFQSGDSSRCEGEGMTFNVNTSGTGPLSYQWYKGTNPIAGATNSLYHIANVQLSDIGYYHVNVNNMCNTTSSNYKLLSVHQNPDINLGNDTTFCDGGTVTLSPGYGYQCIWSNGSYNNQINVTSTGSYFVNVTDQYGCSGISDTVNVNVLLPYNGQQICIVGVDSATNKNYVVWEKAPVGSIESFNIYKESAVSNVWNLIGNVDYDSLSVFTDLTSTPDVKPERYAITVVDSCGNESQRSIEHRTMHLTVNAGSTSNEWNLLWNAYEGFTPSTYRIYRADSTMNYIKIDSIAGSSSYTYLWTDHNAPSGLVYYMVEIVHPQGGCSPTKANTNYNNSRSNTANNGIIPNTALVPDFIASQTTGVAPMIVQFFDQTTNGTVDTWFWNFGDGGNSAVQNPVHQYDSAGVYHVALTVTNSNGTQSLIKPNFIDVLPNGVQNIHANFDVAIFPNPYRGSTNIAYALTNMTKVKVEVYSSLGKLVTVIVDENQSAGSYKYQFDAKRFGFAPGVYYLRMRLDDDVITKRIVEVR
jgi:hypothetical protein